MRPYLHYPVFAAIAKPRLFKRVKVDYGTVVWPGDIYIAPGALYLDSELAYLTDLKFKGNNMQQNQLYYRNSGRGSKITRELIDKFFRALAGNLSDKRFLNFVSETRVPNERELYGVFVKSLLESCGNDLGHIATEFQVERNNESSESEGSKGRVDLLFDFRSVSYLVELKVGRVNAIGNNKESKRAKEIWHEAIEQLSNLKVECLGSSLMKNKIIKLPIVLYFFTSRVKVSDQNNHETIHHIILDSINLKDVDGKEMPDFELYSEIPCTPTRFRGTDLSNNDKNTHLYGFSILAKQFGL